QIQGMHFVAHSRRHEKEAGSCASEALELGVHCLELLGKEKAQTVARSTMAQVRKSVGLA
ncbi:hypothetical protein, partial [Enterobacter cloacae]|uniref:hypothetical protein n=1 Tax=Enterobacter cloacae TaxID=550 RepID=UPI000BE75A82